VLRLGPAPLPGGLIVFRKEGSLGGVVGESAGQREFVFLGPCFESEWLCEWCYSFVEISGCVGSSLPWELRLPAPLLGGLVILNEKDFFKN
jgi:hypothetical protein